VVLPNRTWRRQSGSAVLLAREVVGDGAGEPWLVVRGDRPLEADALAALVAASVGPGEALLAIAELPDAELSAEVKVRLAAGPRGGRVVAALGPDLDGADGVWTGHAIVSPEIADDLGRWRNPALEDAL